MIKNPKINVYINAAKSYYYPGQTFSATILLDVQDNINCNKMTIIAKGKQLIKGSQTNKFTNEEKQKQYESSSSSSSSDEDYPKFKRQNQEDGPLVTIDEKKYIFKVTQDITITENKVLIAGKYSFPFDVEIPNEIPGTFLYLDKKVYAEVAYSVKVKLEGTGIKQIIPIVIRQNEDVFGYPKNNQFERKIHGCCCLEGQTSIKLTANEDYTKTGDPVRLTVNINNDTNTTTTPILVEVYRKLLLKGADNKKIRVTKIVGSYQGKRIINSREKFQKKLHVAIEGIDYVKDHLDQTKAGKSFKHKEIIPFLFQSIKSDNITCEFEVYAESQYANITNDDLGVFLTVLVYPIEDGVISKSVSNVAKTFVNGIVNKKFFLKGENLMKKENEEEQKKAEKEVKKNKKKKKRRIYEESEISEETIKFENKLANKIKKKKDFTNNEDSDDEEVNFSNFKNNNELNSIMNKNNNNNINNAEKETINDMDSNINNNNNDFNNNKEKKINSNNINSADISFGNSSKEKNLFTSEVSSYIKKDFNKAFLNDKLDEELSDDE